MLVLGFLLKLLCGEEAFVRTSLVEVMVEAVLGAGASFRQVLGEPGPIGFQFVVQGAQCQQSQVHSSIKSSAPVAAS